MNGFHGFNKRVNTVELQRHRFPDVNDIKATCGSTRPVIWFYSATKQPLCPV